MTVWDASIPVQDRATMSTEWSRAQGMGARPALIIIDMTYGFVDPRFPIGLPETGQACVEATARLRTAFRDRDLPVLYTRVAPPTNPAERGRWKSAGRQPDDGLPPAHEIVPQLEPAPGETVIDKRRPSAFFGTDLMSLLTYQRVDTVVLSGLVTSGCVLATAIDAFSHNLRVTIPQECVGDRMDWGHTMALELINMKYGDVVPQSAVEHAIAGIPVDVRSA